MSLQHVLEAILHLHPHNQRITRTAHAITCNKHKRRHTISKSLHWQHSQEYPIPHAKQIPPLCGYTPRHWQAFRQSLLGPWAKTWLRFLSHPQQLEQIIIVVIIIVISSSSITVNTIHFLRARHTCRYFTWINSLNPLNNFSQQPILQMEKLRSREV